MSDEMERDYEPEIITLMDDNGGEHVFEVVDSIKVDEQDYVALIPFSEHEDDDESDELIVVKVVEEGEDGESYFEAIEDEQEFTRVADIFTERLSEIFEFEE